MSNILNLALKKEVFEDLQNGKTNEIHIEKTNWWKKRLMDLDTGRFKDFDIARVSSGSSDKIEYEIESLELVDNEFIITVLQDNNSEEPCPEIEDSDYDGSECGDVEEPMVESGSKAVDEKGDSMKQEYEKPSIDVKLDDPEDEDIDIIDDEEEPDIEEEPGEVITDENENKPHKNIAPVKDSKLISVVSNILNMFCALKDVYVVNMPNVTIRNNGQIFGCSKRLIADRENDVRFEFTKKEFIKYPTSTNSSFIVSIMSYMENLMKNNYVFVNKNLSGFKKGDGDNVVFVLTAVAKRKYFFSKK